MSFDFGAATAAGVASGAGSYASILKDRRVEGAKVERDKILAEREEHLATLRSNLQTDSYRAKKEIDIESASSPEAQALQEKELERYGVKRGMDTAASNAANDHSFQNSLTLAQEKSKLKTGEMSALSAEEARLTEEAKQKQLAELESQKDLLSPKEYAQAQLSIKSPLVAQIIAKNNSSDIPEKERVKLFLETEQDIRERYTGLGDPSKADKVKMEKEILEVKKLLKINSGEESRGLTFGEKRKWTSVADSGVATDADITEFAKRIASGDPKAIQLANFVSDPQKLAALFDRAESIKADQAQARKSAQSEYQDSQAEDGFGIDPEDRIY